MLGTQGYTEREVKTFHLKLVKHRSPSPPSQPQTGEGGLNNMDFRCVRSRDFFDDGVISLCWQGLQSEDGWMYVSLEMNALSFISLLLFKLPRSDALSPHFYDSDSYVDGRGPLSRPADRREKEKDIFCHSSRLFLQLSSLPVCVYFLGQGDGKKKKERKGRDLSMAVAGR